MPERRTFNTRHRGLNGQRPHSAARLQVPYELYSDQSGQEPIGSGDIMPGAVTTGSIAPQSITATEILDGSITTPKLATGAITLVDEWGVSVLTPSGFSGAWSDFIANGLYNSTFAIGTLGTLPEGETASLPYFDVDTLSPSTLALVADTAFPSGRALEFKANSGGASPLIRSVLVPVSGGHAYVPSFLYTVSITGGDAMLMLTCRAAWYDSAGTFISYSDDYLVTPTATDATPNYAFGGRFSATAGAVIAPANARYARLILYLSGGTTSYARVGAVSLRAAGSAMHPEARYGAFGEATHTLSTNYSNWNPGADWEPVIRASCNGANRQVHSLVPAGVAGDMKLIMAVDSSFTLTLIHNSANPTDPATKFYCPGNADFVIRGRGSVWVRHTGAVWMVIAA